MDVKVFIGLFIVLAFLIGRPQAATAQVEAEKRYTESQCIECHEEMVDDHAASVHRGIQCLTCHSGAIEPNHEELAHVTCRECHVPHDEKVIHDAHTRVTCKACHQKDGISVVDPASGNVILSGETLPGRDLSPHHMIAANRNALCRSCHFSGNALGASALVLPAKSIMCMPCHVATLSIGDRTTILSLLVFIVGMFGICFIWFSAARGERSGPVPRDDSSRMTVTMVTDVLLLRQLYRLSPARWVIHGLIYYPILLRFTFGTIALGLSLISPGSDIAGAMLDKNHPFQGIFFDLTGLMILLGVVAALVRSKEIRPTITDLPEPSRAMTALLGLVVLFGFVLEGLRIAMTGWPVGSQYAFIGYGVGQLLEGMQGITTVYGYFWYIHAVLTGAFVALIPFTSMLHIFTAPVVLMAGARSQLQPNHRT